MKPSWACYHEGRLIFKYFAWRQFTCFLVFMIPSENTGLIRLIDAAANRAAEGMRAVEDYVRFVLDDGHMTAQWKQLRHDLATLLALVSTDRRCLARGTESDVGTRITTQEEQARADLAATAAANTARVQQSLRSLEEYGKLIDAGLAHGLESLRYRSYTLSSAIETTRESIRRLHGVRLYVLLDGRKSAEEFAQTARALVAGSGC